MAAPAVGAGADSAADDEVWALFPTYGFLSHRPTATPPPPAPAPAPAPTPLVPVSKLLKLKRRMSRRRSPNTTETTTTTTTTTSTTEETNVATTLVVDARAKLLHEVPVQLLLDDNVAAPEDDTEYEHEHELHWEVAVESKDVKVCVRFREGTRDDSSTGSDSGEQPIITTQPPAAEELVEEVLANVDAADTIAVQPLPTTTTTGAAVRDLVEVVSSPTLVLATVGAHRGWFPIRRSGTFEFELDNSYSYFTKKKVVLTWSIRQRRKLTSADAAIANAPAPSLAWNVRLHGWMYHLRLESVRRSVMLTLLRRLNGISSADVDKKTKFDSRFRMFLTNNSADKAVSVHLSLENPLKVEAKFCCEASSKAQSPHAGMSQQNLNIAHLVNILEMHQLDKTASTGDLTLRSYKYTDHHYVSNNIVSAGNGHFSTTCVVPAADVLLWSSDSAKAGWPSSLLVQVQRTDARNFAKYIIIVVGLNLLLAAKSLLGHVELLSPEGFSVISDIDDTIKATQVSLGKRRVFENIFMRDADSVDGMAHLYRSLKANHFAFHYVSNTPYQLHGMLSDFLTKHDFPRGSFHLKMFNLNDHTRSALLQPPEISKREALFGILKDFPLRKFVLVGDSGEKDPELYAAAARTFPGQIAAVLIRRILVRPKQPAQQPQAQPGSSSSAAASSGGFFSFLGGTASPSSAPPSSGWISPGPGENDGDIDPFLIASDAYDAEDDLQPDDDVVNGEDDVDVVDDGIGDEGQLSSSTPTSVAAIGFGARAQSPVFSTASAATTTTQRPSVTPILTPTIILSDTDPALEAQLRANLTARMEHLFNFSLPPPWILFDDGADRVFLDQLGALLSLAL